MGFRRMRVSPLLCGGSSVSHEVRAWGTNGTHTGPGARAWVPPSGLSDLSDPPSKRTHDSPHCPIDQNSVAPVSPQEECRSLVGATTTETYFGQPGLVPGPLGGAAAPEGQCPGRQGSWDSPLWRARPQGLGCVSGGLQSPPQLLAYQRPQPPSAHRPSQGPLSDRSSLCSKASSSKQPPDRLRPALMSVTTPAWLVLHPREGWGEGSRAPGESFGCGAAGLGPWHRGVGGRGGGRGRGASEAQCSRSRRPRPSGPQRHRARSLGPRAPSQAEHREGRGLAALTSPRL